MLKLIQHLVVKEDGTLPETSHCLYAYVLAGNGVFLKAKREGLDVLMPFPASTSWACRHCSFMCIYPALCQRICSYGTGTGSSELPK
jgi:hypothetical protein